MEGLRGAVRSVKGELLGKGGLSKLFAAHQACKILCADPKSVRFRIIDGLTHVFATIKHTPDVRNLPENYQSVLEWARIS